MAKQATAGELRARIYIRRLEKTADGEGVAAETEQSVFPDPPAGWSGYGTANGSMPTAADRFNTPERRIYAAQSKEKCARGGNHPQTF